MASKTEPVAFFKNYLYNPTQKGFVDITSNSKAVQSGFPRGSILGPLLLVIFTSDMQFLVDNDSVYEFSDDIQMYASDFNTHFNTNL